MLPATKKVSTFRLSSSTESAVTGAASESVKVGYVRRAHGIKGAVVVRPLSDDPDRFLPGQELGTDRADLRLTVVSAQPHKDGLLVGFSGVADRSAAEDLQGVSLLVASGERRQLEPGEYWPEQLVGLQVLDPGGATLGTVSAVIEGAAQDRLEVAGADATFEVPFVAALVTEIDITAGRLVVDPPPGLIEGL